MANIKSAKKRILVERRNAERNKAIRSRVKTAIKKVNAAIAAGDKAAASSALTSAISEISKAAKDCYIDEKRKLFKMGRIFYGDCPSLSGTEQRPKYQCWCLHRQSG